MKSLLDKDFKYTPAVGTDVRKTFERVKAEQEKVKADRAQIVAKTRIKGKA